MIVGFWQDLHYGARMLLKHPNGNEINALSNRSFDGSHSGALVSLRRKITQIQTGLAKAFQYKIIMLCICWLLLSSNAAAQNWPQWGGPQRNFMVEAKGLAET